MMDRMHVGEPQVHVRVLVLDIDELNRPRLRLGGG